MKTLKFLIILVIALFMSKGVMAAYGSYNLLHLVAPDSGQVLTNSVKLDFKDVNSNSKPTVRDTVAITADARYAFGFDTRGYKNATTGVSGAYENGVSITAAPGDTVNFNAWFWNDSNDSKQFKIISIVDADAPGADSVTWSVYEDLDGDSIASPADSQIYAGSSSLTTAGRAGSGSDTKVIIGLATIDASATQSAEDTLTVTINMPGDTGIDQQPANKSLVFWVSIQAPFMTLSKTVDITDTQPGGRAVFTLTFGNTGNGNAYNVIIEDSIPTYTVPGYGDTIVWVIANDSAVATTNGTDTMDFYQSGSWTPTPTATTVGSYNVYKSVTRVRYNHTQVNAASGSKVDTFAVLLPWIE